jgi:hypothetical protein
MNVSHSTCRASGTMYHYELIMICLLFEAVLDSTDYLMSYSLNIVSIII